VQSREFINYWQTIKRWLQVEGYDRLERKNQNAAFHYETLTISTQA